MISRNDILNASILIVDDQHANVQLLEQILSESGYRCIATTLDPHAVCELHRANRYDLILLDLEMPGMDGFRVMDGLKEIETNGYLPVLAITAQLDHKLRAWNSGAKDFIAKPFELMEIKMRIHNMLEVRLLYKQLEHYNYTLEGLALHDELTGLPNRRLLMDRLSLAIAHARRNKGTMAVMYLDLDGFKQVNDNFGHDVGDALLKMIATRLVAAVRQEDTVARIGGDEFVIALWELNNADGAGKLAIKVIQALSQPYNIEGRCVAMTVSIGVAIYPTHGDKVEMLMKSADSALYEAKRAGKNSYCVAVHPDMMLAMVRSGLVD